MFDIFRKITLKQKKILSPIQSWSGKKWHSQSDPVLIWQKVASVLIQSWSVLISVSSFLFAWSQWFPSFFWSRTICGSRTVSTYHLVPGKVNVPNIIRSKVWKQLRHEKNGYKNFCGHFQSQQGKYTKPQEFINKIRSIKIIAVNIIFV